MPQNSWFDQFNEPDEQAQTPTAPSAPSAPTRGSWFDQFNAPPPEPSPLWRRATDIAVSGAKGVVDLGEAAVGLTSLATGGYAGKAMHDILGYDPEATRNYLETFYTPEQRQAFENVRRAEGFLGMGQSLWENPSVALHAGIESVPSMIGGGLAGRGVAAVAPRLAGLAGGIGEGLVSAGSAAEAARQQSPDQLLSQRGTLAALATGVGTTALGALGGKIAQRMGIADIESVIAGTAVSTEAKRSLAKQILYGAFQEGMLEEFPQSVHEQVMANYAAGRDLMEGVEQSAVLGAVVGGVMGGGANVYQHFAPAPPAGPSEPTLPPPAPDIDEETPAGPPYTPDVETDPELQDLPQFLQDLTQKETEDAETSSFLENLYQKEEAERRATAERELRDRTATEQREKREMSTFLEDLYQKEEGEREFTKQLAEEEQKQEAQEASELSTFLEELYQGEESERQFLAQLSEEERIEALKALVATEQKEKGELSSFLEALTQKEEADRKRKAATDFLEGLYQKEEAERRRLGIPPEVPTAAPPTGVPPITAAPTAVPPAAREPMPEPEPAPVGAQPIVTRNTPADLPGVFDEVVKAAQAITPNINVQVLKRTFDERLEAAEQQRQSATDVEDGSGQDPVEVAKAIAKMGGIAERDVAPGNRYWKRETGEMLHLKDAARVSGHGNAGTFGSMFGVPAVFRKTGKSPDLVSENLRSEQRFNWIEGPDHLMQWLESQLGRPSPRGMAKPTLGDLKIDPRTQWWVPAHLRAVSRFNRVERAARGLTGGEMDFDTEALETPVGMGPPSRFRSERQPGRKTQWIEEEPAGERGAHEYPQEVYDTLEADEWVMLDELQRQAEDAPDSLDERQQELLSELSARLRESISEAAEREAKTEVEPEAEDADDDDITMKEVEGSGPWQEIHITRGDRVVEVRGMDVGTPPRPAGPDEEGLWFAYEERGDDTWVVARGETRQGAIDLARQYLRGEHDGELIEKPKRGRKAETETEESDKPAVTVFRSGNSRSPSDIDGYIKAGQPVGVTAQMSPGVVTRVIEYVNNGGSLFIDSGAFGNPAPDWAKVFKGYHDVLDEVGENAGNVVVVAPDKVGDLPATKRLQRKFASEITALVETGAKVMFPIQRGDTMIEYAKALLDQYPRGVVFGLPMNKSAVTDEELIELLGSILPENAPAGVHLLGMGENNRRFKSVLKLIQQAWPTADVSADSNRTRALMGPGRKGQKTADALTDERSDEDIDNEWDSDTTELIGQLYRGEVDTFTKPELDVLAEMGLHSTADALTAAMRENRVQEFVDRTGLEDMLFLAMRGIAKMRGEKRHRPGARRDAIAEHEAKPPIAKKASDALRKGDTVSHAKHGIGTVVGIGGTKVGVKFANGNQLAVPAKQLVKAEAPTPVEEPPAPPRPKNVTQTFGKKEPGPKLTFGKKPPSMKPVENDKDQPRLPGDVGEVRDVEVEPPKVELPPQSLTLKQEDAPKHMQEKPPSLFEQSDKAHQDVKAAIADLLKDFGKGGINMGVDPTLVRTLPVKVFNIVKALAKAGVVDAKIAWSQYIEPAFGKASGDLKLAFQVAWRQVHGGELPTIEATHAPSTTPEERAQRFADAQQNFQQQQREAEERKAKETKEAKPPTPAPKPAGPPVTTPKPATPPVAATPKPAGPPVSTPKPATPPVATKPEPPKTAPTRATEEQIKLLDEYGLKLGGYGDRKGDPTIILTGKTKQDTYERQPLFKASEGRFYKEPYAQWHIPFRRLEDFLRGLGALPKATGKAARRLPAHLRDASLAQLRTNAERRSDRSGFDGTLQQYVSSSTQEIIQRGESVGISQPTLDEQKEDVGILVRNQERGNKAGILASDPGTGKTFVLGGTIAELIDRGAETVIYVTKNNQLIKQAKEDMKPFGIVPNVQFMTYSKFRDTPPADVDVLVFDEAHEVKNVKASNASQQGEMAQEWIGKAQYTILATATPYENPTQLQYLEPTGIFNEVFGNFEKFATAFGATPILIDKELGLYDYQWKRTAYSNEDQKQAREWMRKEGFFTSRKMRLPKDQVDTRLVKIQGDTATARVFDAIMDGKAKMPPGGVGAMWISNFAKRLLESSKVDVAIEEAKKALARGRYPIIFVETKAEKIIDIDQQLEWDRQYNLIAAQAKKMGEKPPRRKEVFKDLLPKGIPQILAHVKQQTGEKIIHIEPAEERIQDAFGANDVAIYTGSVDDTKAQKNLDGWRKQGQPRVLVATMAKGGTGLSLHDKVGDHQTTQINVNMPWTATLFTQVTQRSARYGMKGKAEIIWLFAENVAKDRELAVRVGGRLQDMGSLVHGDVPPGAKNIEDWNFDDPIIEDEDTDTASALRYSEDEDTDDDAGYDKREDEDTAPDDEGDDDDTEEQEDEGEEEEEPPPPSKTYYDQPPRGPASHPETGEPVRGLGVTELVELVQDFIGLPKIVERFRKLGTLGQFRAAGEKAGIKIHAGLFAKGREQELAQVLAHEIGHLTDWLPLPDATLKRGNLLGRLFSLRKFLSHTFTKPNGDIVELHDIKPELTRLTELWSPYNKEKASDAFKKYRNSSPELFAEALSALLTDPEFLQRTAPNFYREFMTALDRKPDMKREYEALQAVMALTPEGRADRRIERDVERVKAGSAKAVALQKEHIQKIKDARWKDWMLRLKTELLDKHAPVIKKVKELAARGIEIAEHLDPRYLLQERNYVGGKIRGWVSRNVRPLYERLQENGIDWDHFGLFLEIDRTIQGDYEGKAGPGGRTPATAQDDFDALARQYTPEQMSVVKDMMGRFRLAIQEVIKDAYKAGLYTPELYEQFTKNPAYATFRGIDFLDQNVTAYVHHAKGSFQDIANAADSTILKMMVTIRETQNQHVKRATFNMLTEHFAKEIEKAKRTGPRSQDFAGPKNKDLEPVGYFDHGVWQRMYVDPLIADSLNNKSIGHNWVVMQAINYVNSKVFRPLFVGYNPGFMTFNVVRDFLRTWKNYNDEGQQLSLAGAIKRYRQSHQIAKVRAFGVPKNATDKENRAWSDLTAAEEHFIFGMPYTSVTEREVQETEIKDIMARVGATEAEGPPRTGWRKSIGPVLDLLGWLEKVGNYIETLPKAAAMYEMLGDEKNIEDLTPSQKSYLREKIGTPDIHAGGVQKPIWNELFLFSNIIAQGWRADMNVARRDIQSRLPEKWGGTGDPKTRSGWAWKTAALNVAPKMLMMMAAAGLMGDLLKKIFERVSEYDKSNYLIVPLGLDEKGNAVYLRLPQDDTGRFIGGLAWKAMRGDKNVGTVLQHMASYTGGATPSLTPSLGAIEDTYLMLSGQNPYDAFRSRNLFTQQEMEAGGPRNWKKFLGWEFNQLGGSTWFGNFFTEKRPEEKTVGQMILDAPVSSNMLGRWLKVSDYGLTESMRDAKAEVRGARARQSQDERDLVNDAIREYLRDVPPPLRSSGGGMGKRMALARKIVEEVYTDLSRPDKAKKTMEVQKKIKIGAVRGSADPLVEEVLSAQSNAEKRALIERQSMSTQELHGWLDRAASNGVISRELSIAIKRGQRQSVAP